MVKSLLEIAAEIVQAQASVGPMTPDAMELALSRTFVTLQKMKMAEDGGFVLDLSKMSEDLPLEEKAKESMDPRDSIQNDKIICLECGAEMRQLTTKHLSSHNLNPREYKKKYGFSLKQPLAAKSLTKARSKAAKKRGLPENLVKFLEEKRSRSRAAMAEATSSEETVPELGMEAKVLKKRGRRKKVS